MHSPKYVIVMGVSGSGKSTIGEALASATGWVFIEGDDFHSAADKEKMAAGVALDDADRWPWLQAIRSWITETARHGQSAIISCSALKRSYRDLLRGDGKNVYFCHLEADADVLAKRISHRVDHFMSRALLHSQFNTLEPLQADEQGIVVSALGSVPQITAEVIERLDLPTDSRR